MKDGVPPHHTGMSQDMDIEYSNEARYDKASEKSVYQRPDGMMDDHIVNNVYIKKTKQIINKNADKHLRIVDTKVKAKSLEKMEIENDMSTNEISIKFMSWNVRSINDMHKVRRLMRRKLLSYYCRRCMTLRKRSFNCCHLKDYTEKASWTYRRRNDDNME